MGIHVTEHAVMRWLQRVEGVDMDEVRRAMTPEAVRQKIERAVARGGGAVTFDGVTYCVAPPGVVTTVYTDRRR